MQNIFIDVMPPWVETGLQPAFYDKESGTVLQQVARMYAKVNELVKSFDDFSKDTADTVNSYIAQFTELYNYVHDYFDNLDVQDEINNKLDELVESGTLQRILNSPATTSDIGGVIIKNGLQVDAEGNLSVKPGEGITVSSDGVSITPFSDYIEDIEVKEYNFVYEPNNTNSIIHYSIIPFEYKPKIVMSDPTDPDVRLTASSCDYQYSPTLMTNFGPWNVGSNYTYGPLIIDSNVEVQNNLSGDDWEYTIMGITSEGYLRSYNGDTPASSIPDQYSCRVWRTLFNDGVTYPDIDNVTHNPHTFIAQDYDGNYLIAVCGGRVIDGDTGMTMDDIVRFVLNSLNFDAKLIFNADGGGSSNMLYHGIRQNTMVRGENRACPNWLVWSSPTARNKSVFQNQSINDKSNIDTQQFINGVEISNANTIALYQGASNVELKAQSRVNLINPRIASYNIEFTVTGDEDLPANSDIMAHLPRTNGNYYFTGLNRSTNVIATFVLQAYSEDGVAYSRIRNTQALTHGKLYDFNVVFPLFTKQY